jgi:hypothetical protein
MFQPPLRIFRRYATYFHSFLATRIVLSIARLVSTGIFSTGPEIVGLSAHSTDEFFGRYELTFVIPTEYL